MPVIALRGPVDERVRQAGCQQGTQRGPAHAQRTHGRLAPCPKPSLHARYAQRSLPRVQSKV